MVWGIQHAIATIGEVMKQGRRVEYGNNSNITNLKEKKESGSS